MRSFFFSFWFMLLFSLSANGGTEETMLKDKLVFKVVNEVFSLNDLKNYRKSIDAFNCVYGQESIIIRGFGKNFDFRPEQFSYLKFSSAEKNLYKNILPFFKLMIYSKTYQLPISKELLSSLEESPCAKKIFNQGKKLNKAFKEILSLEIFLRSRFLTSDRDEAEKPSNLVKAVESAKGLTKSVDKQISQNVYWSKD